MDQFANPQQGWKCELYKVCKICNTKKYFTFFSKYSGGRAYWARKSECRTCENKARMLKKQTINTP